MKHFTFLKPMLLLCALIVGVGNAWAADETIDFTAQGYSNQQEITSVNGTNFTITFDKGTNNNTPKYFTNGTAIRAYGGNTMTVSSAKTISKIELTFGSSDGTNAITTDVNTYENGTWTGEATSVKFTIGGTTGNRRLASIAVTYKAGDEPSLIESDFALADAPIALSFDLYNNKTAQTFNYTTSGTGVVTVAESDFVESSVDAVNKTITITPITVTNGEQTIKVNQKADDTYAAGSATFTVTITDSTPFEGGDVTFTASSEKDPNNTSKGTGTITKNGVTMTCSDGILGNGSEYRLYTNSNTTINTTFGKITKIVFTQSGNYNISNLTPSEGSLSDATWTGSTASVTFTASAQARASQIVVTIENDQAAEGQVETPVISVNEGLFLSTKTVTITCATDGAAIQYSTDEGATWSDYSAPFTINNTTTIQAKATKVDMTESKVATTTFTKETVLDGLAELTAQTNTTNTNYYVNLTNAQVTYVNGNNGFMEDMTNGVYVYNVDNLTLNTVYNGIFEVTYQVYNNLPEIKTAITTVNGTTSIATEDKNPIIVDIATLTSNWTTYLSRKVKVSSVLLADITQLADDVAISDETSSLEDGKTYDLIGFVYLNKGNKQFNVVSASEVAGSPAVTIGNATINVDATENNGTIEVTYHNITTVMAEVHFFEADGMTPATYDWVDADINANNNVEYLIEENTSDSERTAYMKVYTIDDESNDVYSELITITQAKPEVDYALLPFSFNSGRDNLSAGLTQSGLGTDYNANNAPNTQMKFDTTGDYLVLKFNEAPGTLSYDIKGNGFSDGNFQVQISADGINYTTIHDMPQLPTTATTETYVLAANPDYINIRYIRWYYENKVNGNVGLGNIKLTPRPAYEEFTITSAGWATWNNSLNLAIPEGVEAYIVESVDATKVNLSKIDGIPARSAVILKGTPGTYQFPVNDTYASLMLSSNQLRVSMGSEGVGDYVLYDGKEGVGFYKWSGDALAKGRVYLPATAGARDFIGFSFGEATGINAVENANENGAFYNLAGQRVAQPTRGLYIVNGKKFVVK